MDRYLIRIAKSFSNSNDIKELDFELEIEHLAITSIFIMLGFFNYKYYEYSSIKKYFSNDITLKKLNEYIIKILSELKYDIYRPFNIYNCENFNILIVNDAEKNISSSAAKDSDYDSDSNIHSNTKNCIQCEVLNKDNNLINKIFYIRNFKDKNKLVSIIKTMIQDKYIGATPEYYYNKLVDN